jgi:hypothetical protein
MILPESGVSMNPSTIACKRHITLLGMLLATACSSEGGKGGTGGAAGAGAGGSGTGGSSSFTPATPPADVCALLTLEDVQTLTPTAQAGVEEPTGDTTAAGFWSRICKYEASATPSHSVELVVFGALTEDGFQGIKLAASAGKVNDPVSGVGDEAHYWEDDSISPGKTSTNGLWALDSPYAVDITNYFFPTTFPNADQMKPLVVKALGQL